MAILTTTWIKLFFRDLLIYRKSAIILIAPLILLPFIFVQNANQASTCAYVVILMAVYWITEALPLAVTSFFPIFLFPFLGVMPVGRTCANYLKDVNFLFVGGLIMAVATEECHLHKRIALRVLISVGSQPRWLMFGFMLTTAFLSMWMSNTATTAMMLPIAVAVLEELIKHHLSVSPKEESENVLLNSKDDLNLEEVKEPLFDHLIVEPATDEQLISSAENIIEKAVTSLRTSICEEDPMFPELLRAEMEMVEIAVQTDPQPEAHRAGSSKHKIPEYNHLPKDMQGMCKAILLSICISANLGGTGTLTGTGPNLVFSGQLQQFFPNQTDITFASWLAFGIPSMVLCLILAWFWLQIFFMGWKTVFGCCVKRKSPLKDDTISNMLKRKYEELGKISFAELSVLFWFTFLVLLWIFRDPLFIPGWNQWFNMKRRFTSDSCAAMFVACILFAWPNYRPDFLCWRNHPTTKPVKRTSLMTWSAMQQKFPWSVIILLGGGFAMADGVQYSGLARWIGCTMQNALGNLNPTLLTFIFICLITGITEVASNTATASIFIPILLSLSQALHVNPLYMALPATVAASFAFMLPVATPPNAIIYESRMIKIKEMIMVGFVLNLLCIGVTTFSINTMTSAIFNLDKYPKWAETVATNITC